MKKEDSRLKLGTFSEAVPTGQMKRGSISTFKVFEGRGMQKKNHT